MEKKKEEVLGDTKEVVFETKEEPKQNKAETLEPKKKSSKGVIILLIVIILGLLGYICYDKGLLNFKTSKDISDENKDKEVSQYQGDWYEPNGTSATLDIYNYKDSDFIVVKKGYEEELKSNSSDYEKEMFENANLVKSYGCENSNCSVYTNGDNGLEEVNFAYLYPDFGLDNLILINDGGYVAYSVDLNKAFKLEIPSEKYQHIKLFTDSEDVFGYSVCKEEDKCAYYSYNKKNFITDFKYSDFTERSDDCNGLRQNKILAYKTFNSDYDYYSTFSVIDTDTGNEVFKFDQKFVMNYPSILAGKNNIFYIESDGEKADIYDSNFKNIVQVKIYGYYESFITLNSDENLMVVDGKVFNIYDAQGNKLKTSRKYKKVIAVANDYVGVVDSDNLINIIDKDENVLAKFDNKIKISNIDSNMSGWWVSESKKEGFYISVNDESLTVDDYIKANPDEKINKKEYKGSPFKYEFYYIPSTKEQGYLIGLAGGYAKPVLYLYPTKDNTKVNVTFKNDSLLTTTYPKYNNGWSVIANRNGDLYDKDGKYYYGLYWEESSNNIVDFKEGFYVTKENAISFLEEKLSIIGLNDRERNEFIMYWLPILEKNGKNLVYFELTEERNSFNELYINPKPDSILRLAIHIKKVDKKVNIKEEKLKTFERKGFTAVEWGGVRY